MTAPPEEALLEVDDLRVAFRTPRGPVVGVDGVSFRVDRGESLGIVGESGSGKSATVASLLRLRPALTEVDVSGSVRLAGRDLLAMPESRLRRIRGAEVGFVFQDPLTALDPAMTVGEQLVETLRCHRGIRRAAARRRAAELLELVGIPEPGAALDRFPRQFSGGMRQRVLIALAICCEPALLIADEATTALDPTVQIQILSLLRRLRRELRMALIVISHDLGVIAAVCDRVQVMYGGVVVEHGPVPQVLAAPRHPYTAGLLRLAPRFEHRTHRRLRPIPGMALTVTGTRHDCRFADRCELADDRCRTEVPPWSHTADGRHGSACWRPPTAVAALASAAPTPQEVP